MWSLCRGGGGVWGSHCHGGGVTLYYGVCPFLGGGHLLLCGWSHFIMGGGGSPFIMGFALCYGGGVTVSSGAAPPSMLGCPFPIGVPLLPWGRPHYLGGSPDPHTARTPPSLPTSPPHTPYGSHHYRAPPIDSPHPISMLPTLRGHPHPYGNLPRGHGGSSMGLTTIWTPPRLDPLWVPPPYGHPPPPSWPWGILYGSPHHMDPPPSWPWGSPMGPTMKCPTI